MKIKTQIPNAITLSRLIGGAVWSAWMVTQPSAWIVCLFWALLAASDGVDGWVARKYGWTSAWGAEFDRNSDKILIYLAIVALMVVQQPATSWQLGAVLSAFIVRDMLVTWKRQQVTLPSDAWGKWKTTLQMVGVGIVAWGTLAPQALMVQLGLVVMLLAVVASVPSMWAAYRQKV